VWQGVLDTNREFGGITLGIDIDVAATANPSGV
jgi:lipid-binding SYLF domain-containing protein